MISESTESLGQIAVVGRYGTPLGCRDGLNRMKREATHVGPGTVSDWAVGGGGPQCVSSVFDHDRRFVDDGSKVDRQAGVVHGNHPGQPGWHLRCRQVESSSVDVNQDGLSSNEANTVRAGHKRQRRGGNPVPNRESSRCAGRMECGGPARKCHRVASSSLLAEAFLERRHRWALGEPVTVQNGKDRLDIAFVDLLTAVRDRDRWRIDTRVTGRTCGHCHILPAGYDGSVQTSDQVYPEIGVTVELSKSTILLTGGTGSFGTAFVAHVLKEWPHATVRVYSRDELKQAEMAERFGHSRQLRFFIGDVRDRLRLQRAMAGAHVVVHAAALKQVPACEYNPSEAVQTNVMGAQNIVDASIDAGVERVIALSTDKAVNPVNLYGATKLCAEKLVVQGNAYAATSKTRLCCVRYGNVIGSRGSVVPLFRQQAESGEVTITDERMTRFWIRLDEAVALVVFGLEHTAGGEIFVPKIPSIRVVDLAEAIAPGVPTRIIGIRPGEKLHERLLTSDESRHTISADRTFVVLPEHPWWTEQTAWSSDARLPEGFDYSSDENDEWMDVEKIREQL